MPVELGSFSFGFVAGGAVVGVINHFLAKSRDSESRIIKDFNEVADRLDAILRQERECPSPTTKIDFSEFKRVLRGRELTRFDSCVEGYETTIKNTPVEHYPSFENDPFIVAGSGHFNKHDKASIIAAIEKLREFTKRK